MLYKEQKPGEAFSCTLGIALGLSPVVRKFVKCIFGPF